MSIKFGDLLFIGMYYYVYPINRTEIIIAFKQAMFVDRSRMAALQFFPDFNNNKKVIIAIDPYPITYCGVGKRAMIPIFLFNFE